MRARPDVSDKLIHFTSGKSAESAFSRLRQIVAERRLISGNRMIRGGYRCVCFTEAPLSAVANGFASRLSSDRYAPLGLMFDKRWVFARGGRPVIYEPDNEFLNLPEPTRWRHVRYEPVGTAPVDFTWEREWRLRCDELRFSPAEVAIVVPNQEWSALLLDIHDFEEDTMVEAYATVFEREIAEQFRDPFLWHVVTLG
jgi:hypothetical protein